jgi:hypothetical protein
MRRLVGALNLAFAPTEKLSFSGGYSNFQSFTNVRSQFININQLTPYDNLDTLNFTQITQSINLGTNYSLASNANYRQFVSSTFSIQNAAEHQSQVVQNSGSRFYNFNTSYSLGFVPSNFLVSLSFNVNQNRGPAMDLVTRGPSVSMTKSLLQRKLKLVLSSAFNNSLSEGKSINRIVNVRANAGYTAGKKHTLNVGIVVVNRNSNISTGPRSFAEYTGTLTYAYAF